MDRATARKIAEFVTNAQLREMFEAAWTGVKDWESVSSVNKGFTRGAIWNLLTKNFDESKEYHVLAKTNMIWEFGDFLPKEPQFAKPEKKKLPEIEPYHEDPVELKKR